MRARAALRSRPPGFLTGFGCPLDSKAVRLSKPPFIWRERKLSLYGVFFSSWRAEQFIYCILVYIYGLVTKRRFFWASSGRACRRKSMHQHVFCQKGSVCFFCYFWKKTGFSFILFIRKTLNEGAAPLGLRFSGSVYQSGILRSMIGFGENLTVFMIRINFYNPY